MLKKYHPDPGNILDPFAGVGATLFASKDLDWKATGIELLPVGTFVMRIRELIPELDLAKLKNIKNTLWSQVASYPNNKRVLLHIPITLGAFPEETEILLNKYIQYVNRLRDKNIKLILRFIALSVLEEISYTRKDGQYLRWDHRSSRRRGNKPFDKGRIFNFNEAINLKFEQILNDLEQNDLFDTPYQHPKNFNKITLYEQSCLKKMPELEDNFFDFIMTSPPYCNRYDYTRTYALELVYLNYGYEEVNQLRQNMLSCTVENKEKVTELKNYYESIGRVKDFKFVNNVYNACKAMVEVNEVLTILNKENKLNNKNIPRMVQNYFYEMCFVIFEMSRVLKKGGLYCHG